MPRGLRRQKGHESRKLPFQTGELRALKGIRNLKKQAVPYFGKPSYWGGSACFG